MYKLIHIFHYLAFTPKSQLVEERCEKKKCHINNTSSKRFYSQLMFPNPLHTLGL